MELLLIMVSREPSFVSRNCAHFLRYVQTPLDLIATWSCMYGSGSPHWLLLDSCVL